MDMDAGIADAAFEQSQAMSSAARRYSENFNRADFANEEEMQDVVESFELLHRSIPWLQPAEVSSESHCGQLKILQAAIDYIIDLEEQLAEQLSGGMFMTAALQSVECTLAASSAAGSRRPFADINGPSQQQQLQLHFPQQHESLIPVALSDPSADGIDHRQC